MDVGSGGGSPGIPLAASLPEREVVLLEAERRKCEFLERWAPPNARVVWGRAEEQETDAFGVALAKALAQPADRRSSGAFPSSAPAAPRSSGSARRLTSKPSPGSRPSSAAASREDRGGLIVVRSAVRTPPGFPRRTGVAKKRPLT